MRRRGWALAALLLVSGCLDKKGDSRQAETAGETEASVSLSDIYPSDAPSDVPSEAVPAGRAVNATNALYDFSYSYPDAVGAVPALKKLFDQRLAAARDELASSSRTDQEEARKNRDSFDQHVFHAKWDVVADLPGWLSLSAQLYTYSEGAHGMPSFETLLWDRRAETVRKPQDLFTSTDALRDTIQAPFCDALDKERAKRRGGPVRRDSGQMFSECIDPMTETLILGSSNHQTFDRIGILVVPYDAGPYAEGIYDVTLPVTGKIMALLKPQYRSVFSVGR